MKFGGASLSNIDPIKHVATLIKHKLAEHEQIIVVVSAMGKMTDHLLKIAKKISVNPPKREQDMLVSVGERISMALLAMALYEEHVTAISFTGSQSGIITCQNHADARIVDVKPYRIQEALREYSVVIVAGFQGVSVNKEITTLGRGGSDTTAVALAIALEAKKVEFYKDVKGIYDEDPKKNALSKINEQLSYEQLMSILEKNEKKILHPRAVILAETNEIPLEIFSFKEPLKVGTIIVSDQAKKMPKVYEYA
ncbi:MAG: aspartate kinase [Chlamydiales bacterium]|nr:aspartate kinase [Chlamydiales bacterium]